MQETVKFYSSLEILDPRSGELIWISRERELKDNEFVQNAASMIVSLEDNDFESNKALLSVPIPTQNMGLSEQEQKLKDADTLGYMARRGRNQAHELIRAKCVPAFFNQLPSSSPLHPLASSTEILKRTEAKTLVSNDNFKKTAMYHNGIRSACFAARLEARAVMLSALEKMGSFNFSVRLELPKIPVHLEEDDESLDMFTMSVFAISFVTVKVR